MPYEGEIEVNNLPQGTTPNQADKIMLIDNATGDLKLFNVASLSTVVSDVSFTNAAKNSLIALLEKVAYIDGNGQQYLNELITNLAAAVTSISVVFTQGATIIYTTDSLDDLRPLLTVTADYSDGTQETINTYTLIGTLSEGTSTITVDYAGLTDTFTVNCTVDGWLYHFEQDLLSSGNKDFGFTGTPNYDAGPNGGYAYTRLPDSNEATGTAIKAVNLLTVPDLSGDFTFAGWVKNSSASVMNLFTAYKALDTTTVPILNNTPTNIATGWTYTSSAAVSNTYKGCRVQSAVGKVSIRLFAANTTGLVNLSFTPPASFSFAVWHHIAVTRKSGVIRLFIDGSLIGQTEYIGELFFADQIAVGGAFSTTIGSSDTNTSTNQFYVDDLFIAEYCKWDSVFDPSTITY